MLLSSNTVEELRNSGKAYPGIEITYPDFYVNTFIIKPPSILP